MSGFHNKNLLAFQVRHGKTEYLLRSFVFGCSFQVLRNPLKILTEMKYHGKRPDRQTAGRCMTDEQRHGELAPRHNTSDIKIGHQRRTLLG